MRLYLLRHGEVTSHRGDVPITAAATRRAFAVGRSFGNRETAEVRVVAGETRRAKDTATHLARGIVDAGGVVRGPDVAFALRNPDLYVSGVRVNMVSSPESLAQQVDGLNPEDVAGMRFFPEFFASPDRIGWWLTHDSPPGETATDIATRMRSFMVSLADPLPTRADPVVAVTHSPVVRAVGLDVLGEDIGEPPWVSGLILTIQDGGSISAEVFEASQT